ncbi:MAG: HNH endonuclease [Verrucomicrobia bacterium]|nr:HNH endonuclease [Verrucomicrobiota bacterium]
MKRLGTIITDHQQRKILDSVTYGGKQWWKHHSGACLKSCPHYSSCQGAGPDGLICHGYWKRSEPSPEVLDVLFHILNEFDFYNNGDIPGVKQMSAPVKLLRTKVKELLTNQTDDTYSEGSPQMRSHAYRERCSAAARELKTEALLAGKFKCVGCGCDPIARYGQKGKALIECHHLIPLASPRHTGKTRKQDLALLCANCHNLVHAYKPELSLLALKMKHRSCVRIGKTKIRLHNKSLH